MSAPTRSSYRPGIGVLVTSSILAACGLRSAKFLRIAASSDQAEAQVATRAAAASRRTAGRWGIMLFPWRRVLSAAECAGDQPALERADLVDQSHAMVAKFPQAGRGCGKELPKAVDGAGHRPR